MIFWAVWLVFSHWATNYVSFGCASINFFFSSFLPCNTALCLLNFLINRHFSTSQQVPAFNLRESKWEMFRTKGDDLLVEPFPASRRCHACVQDPHNPAIVFINGGFDDEQAFNDTWKLDLNLLRWTCLQTATLPHRTYFHSAAATPDGRMTIFGGITDKQRPRGRTADVFVAWITVPKLKDACWEAISFYVKNGKIKLPDDLSSLGLPEEYASRWRTCD